MENVNNKELYLIPCDGKQSICTRHNSCSKNERNFCKNVMLKVFQIGSFRAQFPIVIAQNVVRVDFVFINKKLKPIIIEIDDYKSHIEKRDKESFYYEINRSNELIIKGYNIIHFTFDHLQDNKIENEYVNCIDKIKQMQPITHGAIAGLLPEIYIDLNNENKINDYDMRRLKSCGAKYSKLRDKWYFTEGQQIPNIDDLPDGFIFETWTPCHNIDCDGRKIWLENIGWKCNKCDKDNI